MSQKGNSAYLLPSLTSRAPTSVDPAVLKVFPRVLQELVKNWRWFQISELTLYLDKLSQFTPNLLEPGNRLHPGTPSKVPILDLEGLHSNTPTSCSWASFAGLGPTRRRHAAFEPGVTADSSGRAATANVALSARSLAPFASVLATQRRYAAFEPGVAADSSGWAAAAQVAPTSCSWASFAGLGPTRRRHAAFEPGVTADSSGRAATANVALSARSLAPFASVLATQRRYAAFEPGVAADSSGWAAAAQVAPTSCSWASFAGLGPTRRRHAAFEPGVTADSSGRAATANLSQHALGHRSRVYELPNDAMLRLSPALPPIGRGVPPQHNSHIMLLGIVRGIRTHPMTLCCV
ncbi:hypothetical protein C8F04DRAFT_1192318 [Mycena alexandri]|uniref:Uncharacterized protein n=1 Tax=Mycena alexandri TaxID=1745969 RepID=A0AAD6WT89_9AGAR|nr:hypothetical protein C8F04DRAFT_1192318 [Mycena alexandri]